MNKKEFIISDGILMVREVRRIENCYSCTGRSVGWGCSASIRPATLDEVEEYKLSRVQPIDEVN